MDDVENTTNQKMPFQRLTPYKHKKVQTKNANTHKTAQSTRRLFPLYGPGSPMNGWSRP